MKSQTFLYSMFALALESLTHSHAFLMQPVPNHPTQQHPQHHKEMIFEKTSQVVLYAGFGGGGGPKEKREVKLKPKQQWDRYLAADLKKEKPFRVAVKAEGKSSDEWLEVGNVKSKDSAYTKAAVARQRALIAEHAKRLFPLQVSPKEKIEWAYWDAEGDDWVIADKNVLQEEELPDGFEKIIGFEGRPDPASGYYCVYNEGKLVSEGDEPLTRSSKKLK